MRPTSDEQGQGATDRRQRTGGPSSGGGEAPQAPGLFKKEDRLGPSGGSILNSPSRRLVQSPRRAAMTARLRLAAALVVWAAVQTTLGGAMAASAPPAGFVTATPGGFQLDGAPFRVVGANQLRAFAGGGVQNRAPAPALCVVCRARDAASCRCVRPAPALAAAWAEHCRHSFGSRPAPVALCAPFHLRYSLVSSTSFGGTDKVAAAAGQLARRGRLPPARG